MLDLQAAHFQSLASKLITQRDLPLDYLKLTLVLHLSRAVGPMVTKKQRVTTETTPICMEGEEKQTAIIINLD